MKFSNCFSAKKNTNDSKFQNDGTAATAPTAQEAPKSGAVARFKHLKSRVWNGNQVVHLVDVANVSSTPHKRLPHYTASVDEQKQTLNAKQVDRRALSKAKMDRLAKKFFKLTKPEQSRSSTTSYADPTQALFDQEACRAYVEAQFGVPPNDSAQRKELVDTLLAVCIHQPASQPKTAVPFQHVVFMSNALQSACHGDATLSLQVLQALSPVPPGALPKTVPTDKVRAAALRLQWKLAETDNGMSALLQVEGKTYVADSQRKGRRDALRICTWLASKPNGIATRDGKDCVGSIADFVDMAKLNPRIDLPIGTVDDNTTQLAHQALLYAVEKMQGTQNKPTAQLHKNAYVAWANGFRTSRRGSAFNKALKRLAKLHVYYRRANQHGPRTLKNLGKEFFTVGVANALLNKNKSPLEPLVGHGTMGMELGQLNASLPAFHDVLRGGLDQLSVPMQARVEQLRRTARTPEQATELTRLCVQLGVIDWVRTKGAKGFKLEPGTVREMMAQRQEGLDLDAAILRAELKRYQLPIVGTARKIHVKHFEAMAAEFFNPSQIFKDHSRLETENIRDCLSAMTASARSAQQEADLCYVNTVLELGKARYIASGGVLPHADQNKLSTLGDFKNIVLGRPARQVNNAEAIKSAFSAAATAENNLQGAVGQRLGLRLSDGLLYEFTSLALPLLVGPEFALSFCRGVAIGMGDSKNSYAFSLGKQPKRVRLLLGIVVALRKKFPGINLGGGITFCPVNGEKTAGKGGKQVNITVPRSTDDSAYAQRVAAFLIGIMDAPQEPSPHSLWSAYVKEFGDTDQVSIGLVTNKVSSYGLNIAASANAVAGAKQIKVGPSGVAQYGFNITQSLVTSSHGKMQATARSSKHTHVVTYGAHLATQGALQQTLDNGDKLSTRTVPLLGFRNNLTVAGGETSIHTLERDGVLMASNCFRETFFTNPKAFAHYVNARRENWEAGAAFTTIGGEKTEKKEAIDNLLMEVQALPPGEYRFHERLVLLPKVARSIDVYNDLIKNLGSEDGLEHSAEDLQHRQAQRQALEAKIHTLLNDETSWHCKNLYAVQHTTYSSSVGNPIVAEVISEREARATRKVLKCDFVNATGDARDQSAESPAEDTDIFYDARSQFELEDAEIFYDASPQFQSLTQNVLLALGPSQLEVEVVPISGEGNNCLIRSLLYCAGENTLRAEEIRAALLAENPHLLDEVSGQPDFAPGNQLPGHGPAFEALVAKVRELTGVALAPHFIAQQGSSWVLDGPNVPGDTPCVILYTGTGLQGHYEVVRLGNDAAELRK